MGPALSTLLGTLLLSGCAAGSPPARSGEGPPLPLSSLEADPVPSTVLEDGSVEGGPLPTGALPSPPFVPSPYDDGSPVGNPRTDERARRAAEVLWLVSDRVGEDARSAAARLGLSPRSTQVAALALEYAHLRGVEVHLLGDVDGDGLLDGPVQFQLAPLAACLTLPAEVADEAVFLDGPCPGHSWVGEPAAPAPEGDVLVT